MKKYFFAYLLFFTISSCNYLEEHSAPRIKTLRPSERDGITTLAVLPFENKTGKKRIEEILRKCFFINLSTKGYRVLRLEEVDERLNPAGINGSNLNKENVYKVGRIVKADALIYGEITMCSKKFFGVYSQVALGAEVRMVDVRSSRIIWQVSHIEKTHSDSIPVSPFSIPEAVIESSMNVREKVIEDTADRFAKKCIISIPGKDFHSSIWANTISIKPNGYSTEVYYRVQTGDTLSDISRKFYDNLTMVEEISKVNNGITDETLTTGQELIIPDIPILEDIEESQLIDKNKYKKTVYRVRWGDSLYKIASKVFHDGKRWTVIYDANKQEIKDIKDIPVGQILIIPLTIH